MNMKKIEIADRAWISIETAKERNLFYLSSKERNKKQTNLITEI
jgi:hypothetical protein